MARQRPLKNAPVTEALVDLRFVPRTGLTFAELRQAINPESFGYYLKGPISHGTFGVRIEGGRPSQIEPETAEIGLRLHAPDEKYVAQFRLNGFTLSRLRPYEEWQNLINEAQRLCNVYLELLEPIRVVRIAARFVNNLRLPLQSGESYQRYLTKFVDLPDEVPQAVESFVQRFQVVDLPNQSRLILTLALEQFDGSGPAPVILDIDCFDITDLSPRDPEIWNILGRLRDLKNRAFFGTLTEPAVELYE